MAKKMDEIKDSIESYAEYYKDVMDLVDNCLEKANKIAANTEKKIDELSQYSVTTKGTQMQLAEHTANEKELIGQIKQLADTKFKIKKEILDLAIKEVPDDNSGEDMVSAIADLVSAQMKKAKEQEDNLNSLLLEDTDLDSEIDNILSK